MNFKRHLIWTSIVGFGCGIVCPMDPPLKRTIMPTPNVASQMFIKAASVGSIKKMKEALGLGALVSDRDEQGYNALHRAAEGGHSLAVQFLIEAAGASVNAVYGDDGQTALHIVARQGHADVVRMLIQKGAQATAGDRVGNTPLHYASTHNHIEIVRYLTTEVLTPEEISIANNFGLTALQLVGQVQQFPNLVRSDPLPQRPEAITKKGPEERRKNAATGASRSEFRAHEPRTTILSKTQAQEMCAAGLSFLLVLIETERNDDIGKMYSSLIALLNDQDDPHQAILLARKLIAFLPQMPHYNEDVGQNLATLDHMLSFHPLVNDFDTGQIAPVRHISPLPRLRASEISSALNQPLQQDSLHALGQVKDLAVALLEQEDDEIGCSVYALIVEALCLPDNNEEGTRQIKMRIQESYRRTDISDRVRENLRRMAAILGIPLSGIEHGSRKPGFPN